MQDIQTQASYWKEVLIKHNWYVHLEDFLETVVFPLDPTLEEKGLRKTFYELVDQMLLENKIPLAKKAKDSPNLDEEREKIDTIVIHHTHENLNISLSRLSAIGLIRQYAPSYLGNNEWGRSKLRNQPIWSGHFNSNGTMVFYAYHWIIRPNGEAERLLKDREIGRHSGVQSVNNRSVAIVLAGNFDNSEPGNAQIEGVAKIITTYYPGITTLVGHQDIRPDRTCPGNKWNEWKKNLLELI